MCSVECEIFSHDFGLWGQLIVRGTENCLATLMKNAKSPRARVAGSSNVKGIFPSLLLWSLGSWLRCVRFSWLNCLSLLTQLED